jgi:hypothetical protein
MVTRIAEPVMHPNENLVDVNYDVFIEDKVSGAIHELKEIHRMRYLFSPEVIRMLNDAGLELVCCEEWMTGKEPGLESWSVCYVAKHKK